MSRRKPRLQRRKRRPADKAVRPRGRLVLLWQRYKVLLPIWGVFIGVLALLAALDEWANAWVNLRLSEWTAWTTAGTLRLVGTDAVAQGTLVVSRVCSFEVIGECTAYYPAGIFLAAVVAYPCRWRPKLLGLGLGLPAVFLVNQVRLVSLCYLERWKPALVETAHVLVWQSLIIFLTLLLWLLWVSMLVRDESEAA